jgi:adenylylsulfate kinase-like enzyme
MRAGLISDMTGIDSPFEAPLKPELTIDTSTLNVEESVEKILRVL